MAPYPYGVVCSPWDGEPRIIMRTRDCRRALARAARARATFRASNPIGYGWQWIAVYLGSPERSAAELSADPDAMLED